MNWIVQDMAKFASTSETLQPIVIGNAIKEPASMVIIYKSSQMQNLTSRPQSMAHLEMLKLFHLCRLE